MAKLYYKYGVVNSSKTANALMTIHNYEEQGMNVVTIKSKIDTRDYGVLNSRALASKRRVDLLVDTDTDLYEELLGYYNINVVVVDECQFLTVKQIDELRRYVDDIAIPVICYGLKTDYKTKLFPSSQRLLEVADSISEIKTVCKCGAKAIYNARIVDGEIATSGSQICIGSSEYKPVCSRCYSRLVQRRP